MDRGAWQAAVNRVARVRHDLATKIPPTTQNMFDELRKKKKTNKQQQQQKHQKSLLTAKID